MKRSLKAGRRLRALREQLGLTLRDVHRASVAISRELGQRAFVIPHSRLHDFESKKVIPSAHRFYTLARIYGHGLVELLSWYGIPPIKPAVNNAQPPLNTLSEEFDAMVARMQTPKASAAVDALFSASPKQLGKTYMKATRRESVRSAPAKATERRDSSKSESKAQAEHTLNTLSKEFDEMLTRMQTPKARAGVRAALNASPKELGQAAVDAIPQHILEILRSVDSPAGRKRVRDYLETLPFPHYEQCPGKPGLLVRTDADGKRTVGRFVDREFCEVKDL